ncbi:hypothetical protein AX16_003791 [Volvariella volvacea WC 439]|nr:hypothetical protein AX16_003791 [Volvariella volvacea WC 439]
MILLVKLLFTIWNPVAFYQSTTPPKAGQRTGTENDVVPPKDLRESVMVLMTRYRFILQASYAAFCGLEFLWICTSRYEGSAIGPISITASKSDSWYSGLTFIIGSIVATSGWVLRRQCYKVMKHHFTFHITTLKDHKLITSGPYSIVRHPSYFGVLIVMIGAIITVYSPGSWLHDTGAIRSPVVAFVIYFWSAYSFAVSVLLLCRMPTEDDLLRKKFGKEWEA